MGTALAATSIAATFAAPGRTPLTHANSDAEPAVLTVGVRQDLDSFNVTVGVTVSAYEAWNLHYPTLTNKSATDFSVEPGLAESWEGSDDGLVWTYTLREGLTWSDGTALTANDVAYTINRARDEEWANHSSTVANLDAEAVDDRTVEITSAVPDPKLPVLDVYIVPQHIYSTISADGLASHDATTDPGAGPFVMKEQQTGQFWRMVANDSYYGGRPEIDEIIFTLFTDDDAMAAAIETGEVDAVGDVPASIYDQIAANPDIFVLEGVQGGTAEIGLNAGQGGQGDPTRGHPALRDPVVRKAIAHAIDRNTLIDKALNGHGELTTTFAPSANPDYDLPLSMLEPFDIDLANQMLDDAGYLDTDGDGIREMPDGSNPFNFRYYARSESDFGTLVAEFVTGWMRDIGIAIETTVVSDSELTTIIGSGEYDMFTWAWVPFVDPDTMLSYFTCDQLSLDAEDPSNYYNDASWCDPAYDELYTAQNQELDPATRKAQIEEMLEIFHNGGAFIVLFKYSDLNAIRTDRWTGIVCQPVASGPFLFNNTSPTYTTLRPRGDGDALEVACGSRGPDGSVGVTSGSENGDGDDGSSVLPLVLVGFGVAVLIGLIAFALKRRRPEEDRE